MDAGSYFPFGDLRVMISLGILSLGFLKNLGGAEANADITPLAAIGYEIHPALGDHHFIEV
jgi:hypothetical protein